MALGKRQYGVPSHGPAVGELPDYDHPLMRDCVMWAPLTYGGIDTVADVSLMNQPLAVTGAFITANKWVYEAGRFCYFASNNDQIEGIPKNFNIGNDPRTMSIWFNTSTFPTDTSNPIFALSAAFGDGVGKRWDVLAEDNAVSIAFSSHRIITTGITLATDTWYHLTIRVPCGATQTDDVEIFIDGKQYATTDENGSPQTLNTNTADIHLGSDYQSVDDFAGYLQDFRFWNRALSDDEIKSVYRDPWAPFHRTKRITFPRPAAAETTDTKPMVSRKRYGVPSHGPSVGERPNYDHPLLRDLICWVPFNQTGGINHIDEVGPFNLAIAGTLGAMDTNDWIVHKGKPCIELENNESVRTPNSQGPLFSLGKPVTLSDWVCKDTADASNAEVYRSVRGGFTSTQLWLQTTSTNGYIQALMRWGGTDNFLTTSHSITDGEWHHVVYVFDGSDTHYLYVDGVEVGNASSMVGTPNETETATLMYWGRGVTNLAGTDSWDDPQTNSMMWRRALGADEIAELYRDPWAPFHRTKTLNFRTPTTAAEEETQTATNIRVWTRPPSHGPAVGELPDYDHPLMQGCVMWFPLNRWNQDSGTDDVSLYRRVAAPSTGGNLGSLEPTERGLAYYENSGTNFGLDLDPIYVHPAATDLTMSVWYKWTQDGGPNPGFWRDGINTANSTGGEFFIMNGSHGRPWIRVNSTNVLNPSGGSNPMDDGEWHHNVFVIKSGEWAGFYQDGFLRYENTHSQSMPITRVGALFVQNVTEEIKGYTQDLRFWNRALEPDEIAELYRDPWGPFRFSKLVSFGTGTTGDVTPTTDFPFIRYYLGGLCI